MTYSQQLRDPRWLKRRQEIIERANNLCEQYGEQSDRFEIHHGYYLKDKMAWEYPDEVLYCLCPDCHYSIQELMEVAHYHVAKRNLRLYAVIHQIHQNVEVRGGELENSNPLVHHKSPSYGR